MTPPLPIGAVLSSPEAMTCPLRPLTPRQMQVAEALARGLGYRAVAAELHITVRTVEAHVQQIARLLPNPTALPSGRLVTIWAAQHVEQYRKAS